MTTDQPNADQALYWNEAAGPTWAAMQERMDWQLEPLGRAGLSALAPAAGEAALDIGCGCGASSLELGAAVGADGSVLGVDVSAPMLAVARRRAIASGLRQIRFLEADAQTHELAHGGFDAAFSRFGVMFFADPVAAFANIGGALRPGGRMVFVCWRSPAENPFLTLPMEVCAKHFDPSAEPADPHAPGPFAFADADRVGGILNAAGFVDIDHRPHDEAIGARSLGDFIDLAVHIGPLGRMLREAPDRRDPVMATMREALSPYQSDRGVLLPSAVWIVSARMPGSPS